MTFAPPVRGPHDVPNLRLHLLDRWRPGGQYEKAARMMWEAWSDPHGWRPREESQWQRGHLADEALVLWWVSAEMVDEISHVATELPSDVRPVDIPGLTIEVEGQTFGTNGLVILGKSLQGIDARTGSVGVQVDGFLCGATYLPPVRGRLARKAVSTSFYRKTMLGEEYDHLAADTTEWLPLGRSDWPLLDRLDIPIDASISEIQHASMMEDRRWAAALQLVASDHRVAAVVDTVPADKKLRRPSERKSLPPRVRVVYLRQLEAGSATTGPRGKSGRKTPKAHIVKSHPRWQACGHDLADRKLILIPRHQRGHDDNAAEGPPTVKAIV